MSGDALVKGATPVRMQGLRDRTKDFALRVIRMFGSLPKTPAAEIMGRQVLRSATSVAAIKERVHPKEAYLPGIRRKPRCTKEYRCLFSVGEFGWGVTPTIRRQDLSAWLTGMTREEAPVLPWK